MSRIGKQPITIPSGVSVAVEDSKIKVSGQKGTLEQRILPGINIDIRENMLELKRKDDEAETRASHGLMRSLVNNMVNGVDEGFEKKLEINGVGYRVQQQGSVLKFNLGFSHDITFNIPDGIQAQVEQNVITIRGFNKQQVGQVTAQIRALKKPEPYKGEGISYQGERILRKSGKSGKE